GYLEGQDGKGIKGAKSTGSAIGEFMGQALVMLGGNPVHDMEERLNRSAAQMEQMHAQSQGLHQQLGEARGQLSGPIEKLRQGQALTAQESATVDEAIAAAKNAGRQARQIEEELVTAQTGQPAGSAGQGGDGGGTTKPPGTTQPAPEVTQPAPEVTQPAPEVTEVAPAPPTSALKGVQGEAETVEALGNAIKAGDAAAVESAEQIAERIAARERAVLTELEAEVKAVENAHKKNISRPPRARDVDGQPILEVAAPGGAEPPPAPRTASELQKLGDEAWQAGDFDAARGHYDAAVAQKGQELGKAQEPIKKYNDYNKALNEGTAEHGEVTIPPEPPPKPTEVERAAVKNLEDDLKALQEKVQDATDAHAFERVSEQRAANRAEAEAADQAKVRWEPETVKEIEKLKLEDCPAFGDTAASPRRVIIDGEQVGIWKPGQLPGTIFQGVPAGDMTNMAREVLGAELAEKLGLHVPHAEPWTLVDANGVAHHGVMMRYVPDTIPMVNLSFGQRAVLRAQIAKHRILAQLLGNFDAHAGNYLIDRAGRVWSIDFGMAEINEAKIALNQAGQFPGEFRPGIGPDGKLTPDFFKNQKAWREYRYMDVKELNMQPRPGVVYRRDVNMRKMDEMITRGDMAGAEDAVRRLTDADLEVIVKKVPHLNAPDGGLTQEGQEIFHTLKARRDNISQILDQRWKPGGAGGRQSHLELLPPLKRGRFSELEAQALR
ncbi:MAG: hypothetical protein M3347_10060, partial [Armatimonadota bacterium]|nr:hypothetical protein [Armatimonadota bacterium]